MFNRLLSFGKKSQQTEEELVEEMIEENEGYIEPEFTNYDEAVSEEDLYLDEEWDEIESNIEDLENLCKKMFPIIYWMQMRKDLSPEQEANIKEVLKDFNKVFPGKDLFESDFQIKRQWDERWWDGIQIHT